MKIKTATGMVKGFMKLRGYVGWTSLWGTVYLLPGYENDAWLIRHESTHLEQMRRDGKIIYMLKTVIWLVLVGYKDSPYEVEARKAAEAAG